MREHKTTITLTVLVILLLSLGVGLWFAFRNEAPFSQSILSKVNYPLFYPNGLVQVKINKNSIKYNQQQDSVNYLLYFNKTQLTFSQQASPQTFIYDPNLYPEFVDKFGVYANFASIDGTTYLTQAPNSNSQTAIMNTKGTLMFIRTDNGDLSQNNWRLIFNSLAYIQPK